MGTFKKDDVIIITDFGRITSNTHTTNFTLNKPYILEKDFNKENGLCVKIDDNNNKGNGWYKAFDLGIEIELYKEPTLTEQLQKAQLEVERLQNLIEEENKPKVGDFVYNDYTSSIYKKTLNNRNKRERKITNPELIKLLEDECSSKD